MILEPMVLSHPVAQRTTRDERDRYYELAAIDRPLFGDEQADLHAISTGALITPTSCVDHDEREDPQADPRRLVEGSSDASHHWGCCPTDGDAPFRSSSPRTGASGMGTIPSVGAAITPP
ncbi:hypothetical protein [Geodermatophilus sp. URMC 62]|uniref:hypothetical protein n=1 Tax=Geodermatophilus sp. URMC 62 TaxID=3423414 RepID=UPI00406D424D